MNPPIQERLGWRTPRDAALDTPTSTGAMASAAFWFAAAAVVLTLASIALPHTPEMDEAGLATTTLAAACMAGLALVGFDRLPLWSFHAGCLTASFVATATIYFWGEGSLYGPLPYLWPTLYAFYCFSRRWALAQMAGLGVAFAGLLLLRDTDYTPAAGWLSTIGTLTSAGILVSIVRDRVSAVIADLSEAARRDPLTELLNRRGFEETFEVEIERARRTERTLSVILGDLDRFKQINDRFGHGAGDEALRRVAGTILESKRSGDAAARIGGEEFAIIAPDTDEHGAYILAERLRIGVEAAFEGSSIGTLTTSFGIASSPTQGRTAEALLHAGDQALYAAKRLGRNRSVISSAEVPGILERAPRGRDEVQVELGTLLSLAEALDVRDNGNSTHCQRVGRLSELIARELGMPPDSIERIRIAGILHDVGRVGVPDALFVKEGPLSDEEWHWIHRHPEVGARMLETTDFGDIGSWILAHHERPDGTGYPNGAEDAPLESAILGVADAYEAMTAVRPYRPPLDPRSASEELRRGAGRQFDERVVQALLRVVRAAPGKGPFKAGATE